MFQPYVVTAPPLEVDDETAAKFELCLGRAVAVRDGAVPVVEGLPGPPHEFLRWLAEVKGFLLHGSNHTDIAVFEPRPQTDAVQRGTRAVFATGDGLWPMFFAIVDRSRRHSLRNGFWQDDEGRHYNFAVDAQTLDGGHFVRGALYLLPREGFAPCVADDGTPTEEWLCPASVTPLARVLVEPHDFPFLDAIRPFDASEVFRFADALATLEREATEVREDETGLTLVAPGRWRAVARDAIAALPHLELADVVTTLTDVDGGGVALRLTGPPPLLRTVRTWAALPP